MIFELRQTYQVKFLCDILKVSESSYYKWLKNKDYSNEEELEIVRNLKTLQIKHKYRMGSERMTYEYERIYHKKYNHKRIARLMNKYGLQSVVRPKIRRYGITKNVYSKNKLNRNFGASSPYDKLATDISEFKRSGKKVYLSIIKDLYTHVIEALEISYSPSLKLVVDTINQVKDKALEYGTFFHSDQGFQYTNPIVQKILKDNNFLQSMSRKGTPIDNAPTESFFSTLKSELIYNRTIDIPNDKVLIQEIIDYIYYYNNERIQKSLGYLTPMEFKNKYKENDESI